MTSGRTSWLSVIDLQDTTPAIKVANIVVISNDVFLSSHVLKTAREMFLFLRFLQAAEYFVAGDSVNSICASELLVAGIIETRYGDVNAIAINNEEAVAPPFSDHR